jgi:hypothetical protein
MIGFNGYASMTQAAVSGIAKSFDTATKAAEQVTRVASSLSSTDRVQLTPEAVAAAASGMPDEFRGIEKPMIDLRVAKYTATASARVLHTADEMLDQVEQIVR